METLTAKERWYLEEFKESGKKQQRTHLKVQPIMYLKLPVKMTQEMQNVESGTGFASTSPANFVFLSETVYKICEKLPLFKQIKPGRIASGKFI